MGIAIDKRRARTRLEQAVDWALSDRPVPREWIDRSFIVGQASSISNTPVLGTALLARATNSTVDALALKGTSGSNAYSARGLATDVLVPASVEYRFDIRTTGREPLNNQPFFHSDRVDRVERVRYPEHHRYLVECLEAANLLSMDEALAAFSAYLRTCFQRAGENTVQSLEGVAVGLRLIVKAAKTLLGESVEGGKRAQALVAAVFDVIYGTDRVRSRLVNDPSRDFPGDVQGLDVAGQVVVSAEVRTKPMPATEIEQFARVLARAGITRAMAVVLAANQPNLPYIELAERLATDHGVLVTVIDNVDDLLLTAFAWSTTPLPQVLDEFPERVSVQLREIDATHATIQRWAELVES